MWVWGNNFGIDCQECDGVSWSGLTLLGIGTNCGLFVKR